MENWVNITLPSKCKTYQNVDPTNIKIRTLLGKDEERISELSDKNIQRKFLSIIENIVTGVDVNKITSGDAKYILLWEAINSYSEFYRFQTYCPTCDKKIEANANLKTINVVNLSDEFVQPFEVGLSSGQVITNYF
jgi:hypothetical protein